MTKEIPEHTNLEEIKNAFNDFEREFYKFYKTFYGQLNILEESRVVKDKENKLYDCLSSMSENIDSIKDNCKDIKNTIDHEYSEENTLKLIKNINNLIESHQNMVSSVNEIKKGLPIMQTIELYLFNAITLLGNLCTAVANFLTITAPQKAKDAKAAMVTSFTNLKKNNSKENNGYEDFGLQHEQDSPTPPSSPRHDG